jgi:hypothetical protein
MTFQRKALSVSSSVTFMQGNLEMEAASSPRMLVSCDETTWCHNTEDNILNCFIKTFMLP